MTSEQTNNKVTVGISIFGCFGSKWVLSVSFEICDCMCGRERERESPTDFFFFLMKAARKNVYLNLKIVFLYI